MSGDTRQPIGWATYPGAAYQALCDHIAQGRPMGPNYMGELMWPIQAIYDPATKSTRVGFSLIPPPEAAP